MITALCVLQVPALSRNTVALALILVAALSTIGLALVWRLCTALVTWALLTGFVYNQYGDLTFAPSDLRRLAVLLAVTISVAALARPLGRGHWTS